jgi:ribosome-associated protein
MTGTVAMEPVECARMVVDVASEKLASDIVMLDLKGVSDFTDYFVILTADSSRQMRSVAGDIEESLTEAGARLHHTEGTHNSGWMLMDFGDVIVHVMGPEERDFYRIEGAWSEAQEVVRIQ